MGIDIDGKMILGAHGSELDLPDDALDWAEENGLDYCSLYFDADSDDIIFGYEIDEIEVDKIDEEWLKELKDLGQKFYKLTGVKATLYGSQNVW